MLNKNPESGQINQIPFEKMRNNINHTIETLKERMGDLESRLKPVLKPMNNEKCTEPNMEKETNSIIISWMKNIELDLNNMIEIINIILQALEI